jgi:hypothetical protein
MLCPPYDGQADRTLTGVSRLLMKCIIVYTRDTQNFSSPDEAFALPKNSVFSDGTINFIFEEN